MPDQDHTPAELISQQLFDTSTARWAEITNQPDAAALKGVFLDHGQLVTGVGFSMTQIAQLVATVGAAYIKVRFLIKPADLLGAAQFSLALFATDLLGARVSSYYKPQKVYTGASAFACPSQPGIPTVHKNQLHYVLAERWRQNWAATGDSDMKLDYFDSHYGPLRGYTYELNEFVALFLLLEKLEDASLQVHFVLHDYYRFDPKTSTDTLAKTFALALRLKRKKEDGDMVDDIDDPILDNGAPCPPTC